MYLSFNVCVCIFCVYVCVCVYLVANLLTDSLWQLWHTNHMHATCIQMSWKHFVCCLFWLANDDHHHHVDNDCNQEAKNMSIGKLQAIDWGEGAIWKLQFNFYSNSQLIISLPYKASSHGLKECFKRLNNRCFHFDQFRKCAYKILISYVSIEKSVRIEKNYFSQFVLEHKQSFCN